jgi:hypothetical protein
MRNGQEVGLGRGTGTAHGAQQMAEGVAQRGVAALGGGFGPQQRGQVLARLRSIGQGQVGQERQGLPGGEAQGVLRQAHFRGSKKQ